MCHWQSIKEDIGMKIRTSLCGRKCLQSIQCFALVFIITDNDLYLYGRAGNDELNLVDEITMHVLDIYGDCRNRRMCWAPR